MGPNGDTHPPGVGGPGPWEDTETTVALDGDTHPPGGGGPGPDRPPLRSHHRDQGGSAEPTAVTESYNDVRWSVQ